MKRKTDETDELNLLTAAYLTAQGTKQTEIAKILGLSQTAVSRLIKAACNTYLRREGATFLHEKVDPSMMERIRQHASPNTLGVKLVKISIRAGFDPGPVVRVFPCNAHPGDRPRELSGHAAPYIRQLILRTRICGLTWGGMLSFLVDALRHLAVPPPWAKHTVEVIPLSGEPLGDNPTTFSSSSLARELGRIVNGQDNALSLAMVPAFIPDGFSQQEIKGVWRLIGLVQSYSRIFGSHDVPNKLDAEHGTVTSNEPMADNLDMILTSVGSAERPLGGGGGRLFETGNLKINELKKLIVGDMGGVCFSRPNLSGPQADSLLGVTNRWTGLRENHLYECSQRSREEDPTDGPPGVVVVCAGEERAPFLLDAVKRGLLNHLIIDDLLQRALEDLADKELKAAQK